MTKLEIALGVLRSCFKVKPRWAIADIVEQGREIGVSRRTFQRANKLLGVREVHNGPFGAFWEL
jgi:hypothetical protein